MTSWACTIKLLEVVINDWTMLAIVSDTNTIAYSVELRANRACTIKLFEAVINDWTMLAIVVRNKPSSLFFHSIKSIDELSFVGSVL